MLQTTMHWHAHIEARQYEETSNLPSHEKSQLRGGHYHICGTFIAESHGFLGWNPG